MEKSQNDLQAIYNLVSKRYVQLKREAKNTKEENQSSKLKQDLDKEKNINNKCGIDFKSKLCFNKKKQFSSNQLELRNYQDEYKRSYIGKERAFFIKYKNNLNAIKFLKHCLFSQINQLDFTFHTKKMLKNQKLQNVRIILKNFYSYISQKQIMVFLILGLVMFCYNLWNQYREIIIEKQTLDNFRLRYENESEALYQILRQKHALYEKIQRHKNLGIIQSLLNRQIKLTLSFILGVLFVVMSLIKALFYYFSNNKISPMPLFSGLEIELQNQYLNQRNQKNKEKPKVADPQQISELFQQQKMKKEQQFMDIFNQQKEYILKRKQEELIKKEILEQKKNQLLSQLNYLNQQKQVNLEKKRQNQRNTLSMCSFQNSEADSDIKKQDEGLSFISQYYRYDQVIHSEDDEYDLPQFGQKKPIQQLNKYPKKSKLIVQSMNKLKINDPPHTRSKSIGSSSFQIINTKNESESYKFCDRLF